MNKKNWYIIGIILLIISLYFLGTFNYLSFSRFNESKDFLQSCVKSHYLITLACFIVTYITITALSIPSPSLMSIIGGFLFGPVAIPLVNMCATTGATLNFLSARYLYGKELHNKYAHRITSITKELKENGHWYLLSVRFLAFVPFTFSNILIGLTPVSVVTFIWTTSLGILPINCIYVLTGYQIAEVDSVKEVFCWPIIFMFVFLTFIGILPVLIKKTRKTKRDAAL